MRFLLACLITCVIFIIILVLVALTFVNKMVSESIPQVTFTPTPTKNPIITKAPTLTSTPTPTIMKRYKPIHTITPSINMESPTGY